MSKYDQLNSDDKLSIDLITANANMIRDAINKSDMTLDEKGEEIYQLHQATKKMICEILLKK